MGEFHRKSSAKKECIVGIKEKRQEEKKKEEEERRKNGWKRKKKEIYIYIRGSRKKCCVLYTSSPTVRLKFPLIWAGEKSDCWALDPLCIYRRSSGMNISKASSMLRPEFINKIYIYRYGCIWEDGSSSSSSSVWPIGVLTIRTNQSDIQTESQLFHSLSFELKALFLEERKNHAIRHRNWMDRDGFDLEIYIYLYIYILCRPWYSLGEGWRCIISKRIRGSHKVLLVSYDFPH